MKYLLLACLLSCYTAISAQNATLAIAENGEPVEIKSIYRMDDGSYLVGGVHETPVVGTNDINASFYIARLSVSGAVSWARRYDALSDDYLSSISVIANGNYTYVYLSYIYHDGAHPLFERILKLDENGNLIVGLGYAEPDKPYNEAKLMLLPNGNVVLLKSLLEDFRVVCFDSDLNMQWSKIMSPDPVESKNPALGMCAQGDSILLIGKSDNRLVLTSFSTTGQYHFGHRYDNFFDYLRAYGVVPVAGGSIAYGYFNDLDFEHGFFCKLDAQGNVVWIKTIANASFDSELQVTNAQLLPNGNLLFYGSMTIETTFWSVSVAQGNVIGEIDTDGNVVWSKGFVDSANVNLVDRRVNAISCTNEELAFASHHGGGGRLTFGDVAAIRDGNVCDFTELTLVSDPLDYDYSITNIPAGEVIDANPIFLAPTITLVDVNSTFQVSEVCDATFLQAIPSAPSLTLSPNPASTTLRVDVNTPGSFTVYNPIGQVVLQANIETAQSFDLNGLVEGIYVATLVNRNGSISEKISVHR